MNMKLNMKKIVSLLLGCALAGTMLAGCGPTDDPHKSSGGKPLKLGMLTNMNISEQQHAAALKEAGQRGPFIPGGAPGQGRSLLIHWKMKWT